MILLVSSNKDAASVNIANQILQNYPSFQKTEKTFEDNPIYAANINQQHVKLIRLNEESVNAQNIYQSFPSKLAVFISRHSSQSGTPTLTVHAPGNFADADLGGLPKMLSMAPATAMGDALKTMDYYKKKLSLNYEVSFEVTHHGPCLKTPAMFVELGSSPQQWSDTVAATVVAHAAISAIEKFDPQPARPAVIGIGGTHYNQKFTQMALDGEAIFGHMIPKYHVASLDAGMIKHCIERSLEKVSCAILDWKGIKSEDKPGLVSALDAAGLVYRKI